MSNEIHEKLLSVDENQSNILIREEKSSACMCIKQACISFLRLIIKINEKYQGKLWQGNDNIETHLPGRFASKLRFWKVAMMSLVLGITMGVIGLIFLNIVRKMSMYWMHDYSSNNPSEFEFFRGKIYWILISSVAGLLIGFLRYLFASPETDEIIGRLYQEINDCRMNYRQSPRTFLLSLLSLSTGANLGPELVLCNLGGGIATWLTEYFNIVSRSFKDNDKKLIILSGMVGAIGALFPSPLLSVMSVLELLSKSPPRSLMESIMLLSFSAIASYLINFALLGYTQTDHIFQYTDRIGALWKFEISHCLIAFYIGCICAAINIVLMILFGLCKIFVLFLQIFFEYYDLILLKYTVPPLLCGLFVGILNYCLPLTIGNGDCIFNSLITLGYQQKISTNIILLSVCGRLLTLTFSLYGQGFVGGIAYPLLTIGLVSGTGYYNLFPSLPYGLCIACFTSSMTACIVPMPYTMTVYICLVLGLNLYQASVVFIAVCTSYILISGTGFMHFLQVFGRELKRDIISKYLNRTIGPASSLISNPRSLNETKNNDYRTPLKRSNIISIDEWLNSDETNY